MVVSGGDQHRGPGGTGVQECGKTPKLLWQDPSMQYDYIFLTSCLPPSPDGREID